MAALDEYLPPGAQHELRPTQCGVAGVLREPSAERLGPELDFGECGLVGLGDGVWPGIA